MKHMIILSNEDILRICAGDEVKIDIKQDGETYIMIEDRYKRLYSTKTDKQIETE